MSGDVIELPLLLGESPAIVELRKRIERVARVDAPVLITGETGTGKELVAKLLHRRSARAQGPFVAVNCAALPEGLFQAELFGYEKGAFTGAWKRTAGRVESAQGGTLFLDEIGDLRLDNQVALLRFLQEGIFERLGSHEPISADVRIIAATHENLEKACREGRFREDLYYRLNTLSIHTAPLRERGEDVIMLAEHFMRELAERHGLNGHALSLDARIHLAGHCWPGNVRELRNRVLQALALCENRLVSAADLGLEKNGSLACLGAASGSLKASRRQAERTAIEQALVEAGGNVERAADRLEVSRAQLYRLIKLHHLEAPGNGRH
jgi:two-component system, NtrC family, response regulator HydG